MADDTIEDNSPPTSHPFFVRGGFPFVFVPTTVRTGFPFSNNHTHVSSTDNQTTNESKKQNKNDENNEEIQQDEDGAETIDDDEKDRKSENDDSTHERNDLRISQPKYSQLLKELDFSRTRMVDVTNLLSNELDQQENYLTPDENKIPQKPTSKTKYETSSSSSSSASSDGDLEPQSPKKNQKKDDQKFVDAVENIENDLNNLAAAINAASQNSPDKHDEDNNNNNNNIQKKSTFDEDDDTSKQATQDYDLHDNEQEDLAPSSKSSKIPRFINQNSNGTRTDNKTSMDTNTNSQTKKQDEKQETLMNWENLVFGSEQIQLPPTGLIFSQATNESHTTPKKSQQQQQQSVPSSGERTKRQTSSSSKQDPLQRFRRVTTSSSSSDTDSIVEHKLQQSNQEQISKESNVPAAPISPPKPLRQDSQATLGDENLDDLSSQLKQVLIDQERQTVETSTKEERTIDGLGSMSFPLSTPDVLSNDVIDNDTSNRLTENLLHRLSNQRHSNEIPQRLSSNRKATTTTTYSQKYSTSHYDDANSRKTDEHWLTMLERLEREHKVRLEKQQQQYEDYMHTLEQKMKKRYDDYLTLTNGFQESRLDNHDNPIHINRIHTSIPIDSNLGRYKTHTHTHQYRPLAKDLISHYYPADSTLNILTTEKTRSVISDELSRSPSREDYTNLRTEFSTNNRHAKNIPDLSSYYEKEINELKIQLNRARMGQSASGSSTTRQSIETIERLNNENIRLHDEVSDLRHGLKMTDDENLLLKKQLEELREQLNNKDHELKTYHRTISDLEKQLSEAENTKELQDEKSHHAERQILFYREENERLKTDINLSRERLLRLEERYREQENENEILRKQLFMLQNDISRDQNRMTDDHKISSTMTTNVPPSRDYARYTLTSTTKNVSSPISTPRDTNITSERYQPITENYYRHAHSPRPLTRITDYLNERPTFPQPYVSPTRTTYSPRKPSSNRRRVEPVSTRPSTDRQTRHGEQLEQKFDQLLKKKRDLEARLSRIPIRGLTTTDRQLHDVLHREIDRVEQQISSVKLELRKLNIIRTH